MKEWLLKSSWLGLLEDWLNQEELDAPELRSSLISLIINEYVPIVLWNEMLKKAALLKPNMIAHTALAIGTLVKPSHVGVLAYLALSSDNMMNAFQIFARYEPLLYGSNLSQISLENHEIHLAWPKSTDDGFLADIIGLIVMVEFVRHQIGHHHNPTRICLAYPPPLNNQETELYTNFFCCPVVFNDTHNRIFAAENLLNTPMQQRDKWLHELLDTQANALLSVFTESDGFDQELQQVIIHLLPCGDVSLVKAAKAMCVSIRTLQRRLSERNQTWSHLVDSCRKELASEYIQDLSLSLSDIANLLGFAQQSTFQRSFRRWHQQTPHQLRLQAKRHIKII